MDPREKAVAKPSSMNYLVTHGPGRKTLEKITLRPLSTKDVGEVARIDLSLLGTERKDFWRNKIRRIEKLGIPSLAAEVEGKVIAFILGKASDREYGTAETVGWIDTIGVDREWQRKGISQLLFTEMRYIFKNLGITTIYVFVNRKQRGLVKFFEKVGYTRGDMVHMELRL